MFFIIEELKLDPLENEFSSAIHYETIGVTEDADFAAMIEEHSPMYNEDDCWALVKPTPKYKVVVKPEFTSEDIEISLSD